MKSKTKMLNKLFCQGLFVQSTNLFQAITIFFLRSAHTLSTISIGITVPFAIRCQWKKLAQLVDGVCLPPTH